MFRQNWVGVLDTHANESKVGYQSLTSANRLQIAKDVELMQSGQIQGSAWNFFQSPVTGAGRPSGPLADALRQAGNQRHNSLAMTYEIITPPFTLKFREMSKKELVDYGRWFHASIDERISQLETAVRSTHGYESWEATNEPETLAMLGNWFAAEITVRPRNPDEIATLQVRSELLASTSSVDLTNRSFSLAIDVGMYVARTLVHVHPQLQWEQSLNDKKFADYGHPTLTGFGSVPLNPVRIAVSLAYGIAAGKQSGKRLRELFDYWSNQARIQKH
jgi:hypothetical protein